MSIDAAIVARLKATPAVESIVSGRYVAAGRPAGDLPNIVYQQIGEQLTTSNSGDAGLDFPTFQLTCQASDIAAAIELADAVRLALHAQRFTAAGRNVVAFQVDRRHAVNPPPPGKNSGIPGVACIFRIAHSAA